jgi:hypothetical protein|tara:strand:+ start:552 stop:893 length:342 start_codon:yes stop_codon:yes gene_type:complete
MNKITYFVIAIILMLSSASALEKKDCTGLKKLSKAFIACKSGNLKAGIINTGSSIKQGTVGKIKKEKKINNENDTSTATKIVNATKDKTSKVKSSISGLFKGTTKQYPKGIKK